MSAVAEYAQLWAYQAGWSAVRALPEGPAYALFRQIADAAWRRRGPAARGLERNLARVVPDAGPDELRHLVRQGLRSYMRYWCDAFRIGEWSHTRITERVRADRPELISEPLAQGQGVVVALPHMANWDHAGAWACLTLGQVTSVAERLKPEPLFERFLSYRERLGMRILPLTGGEVDIMGELAARLRAGGLVCLPAERDLSQRGVPVRFFGETTRMPAGPAMLALRTGAVLLPVTMHYEGREPDHELVITFADPVEVPAERANRVATMTQRVARAFEAGISQHPEDWHMTQRLFLSDLDADDPRRTDRLTTP